MKRFISFIAIALAIVVSSCSKFDDTDIWNKLNEHEKRIVALEELCKQMNTNISSLQSIVNALQKNDYITNVSPVRKDGEEIGYTITFAYGDTITIYHGTNGKDGANGKDGKDGYTPQIGVMKDTDGIYYWTVDGEWLLDGKGNKVQANGVNGTDGTNGSNGTDGKDGSDGADGITPRLKIENDYWYISYDNGATWTELGKATGEDGKDGQDGNDGADGSDGADGDSIFSSVTQDNEYVYFNLADGTMITLPKHDKENIQFEDLQVKAICCKNWDTNNDGELSYAEAAAVTTIGTKFKGSSIIAFNELKYFTGITYLYNGAFSECSSLWKLTIPQGVTDIQGSVFKSCTSLTNITIPNSVTTIGSSAFSGGTALNNILLPNSVTSIGSSAFNGCSKTKLIYIGKGVKFEGGYGYTFDGCSGELVCLSTLVSTRNSNNGGTYGMLEDSKFDKVTLGGVYIDNYTFNNDIAKGHPTVKTLILEDSVQSISSGGIECNVLHTIYCKAATPPSCTSYAFDCPALQKIYVPKGKLNEYQNASGWKDFASKMEEFDFENNQEVE